MPRKDPQTVALPSPLTHEDIARAEEAYRQLAYPRQLIQRCQRCDIPVSEADRDCTCLENWFAKVLSEFTGPNAPIGE